MKTIVILYIILIAGCDDYANAPSPRTSGEGKTTTSDNSGVKYAGREFAIRLITPALKAPATADFPSETVSSTTLESIIDNSGKTAQRWSVSGGVDSQNSFGAQLRSSWTVILLLSDNEYYPVAAELEGQIIYMDPEYLSLVAASDKNTEKKRHSELRDKLSVLQERISTTEKSLAGIRNDNAGLIAFVRARDNVKLYESTKSLNEATAAAYAKAETAMKSAGTFTDKQIESFQTEEKALTDSLILQKSALATLRAELR